MSGDQDVRLPKLELVDRGAFLVEAVRNRRTLSVGLGGFGEARPYSFDYRTADLRHTVSGRIGAAASSATFVDVSEGALRAFEALFPGRVHRADVTTDPRGWPQAVSRERYDVIVLGEVLEHLTNPGLALGHLTGLLAEQGTMVITVPNAFALGRVVTLLGGVECVHPEHTCHYSYVTGARLVAASGLKLAGAFWYCTPRPHSPAWLRRAARRCARAIVGRLPQFADGLVLVARVPPA